MLTEIQVSNDGGEWEATRQANIRNTLYRISHDWEKICQAILDGKPEVLQGFAPMAACPEFDDIKKALKEPEEARKNPFVRNEMFATPKDAEALLDYALRFNGSERQVALAVMNMTLNHAWKEVEELAK